MNFNVNNINKDKLKIFLFFLLLTTVVWFFIELSKTYTGTVNIRIKYQISEEFVLIDAPIRKTKISLKTSGFKLVSYKLLPKKVQLHTSQATLKGKKNEYSINPNNQLARVQDQFSGNVEINRFLTSSIPLELGILNTKKIAVKLTSNIQFASGYNFTSPPKITPDSIKVSGPKHLLDTLQFIRTELVDLENVSKNFSKKVKISPPSNITLLNKLKSITINASVDKFTEGKIKLPVTVINKPKNLKLILYPNEIELTYRVGFKNYQKVNSDDFSIIYDFKQYENDTLTQYLSPVILQKSNYITSLTINPKQVTFLIQR